MARVALRSLAARPHFAWINCFRRTQVAFQSAGANGSKEAAKAAKDLFNLLPKSNYLARASLAACSSVALSASLLPSGGFRLCAGGHCLAQTASRLAPASAWPKLAVGPPPRGPKLLGGAAAAAGSLKRRIHSMGALRAFCLCNAFVAGHCR